jgi:hypothetical protein
VTEKTAAAPPGGQSRERAADLTADTFVAVIAAVGILDPREGTARAWIVGDNRWRGAVTC